MVNGDVDPSSGVMTVATGIGTGNVCGGFSGCSSSVMATRTGADYPGMVHGCIVPATALVTVFTGVGGVDVGGGFTRRGGAGMTTCRGTG